MKFCKLSFLSLVAATLVACGGGGGGDAPAAAADAADKYVGTWAACGKATATSTTSTKVTFIFSKTGATSLNQTVTDVDYPISNCTGTPFNPQTEVFSTVINGTKVIGGSTVDIVTSTQTNPAGTPFNQILFVNGTSLQYGSTDTGTTADANGYPNALGSFTLTKQ
jgi:hypothetical protein